MKTRICSSSAALTMTLILAGSATNVWADDGNTDRNNQFDFALIGDVPYAPTGVVSAVIGATGTVLGNKTVQTYPAPDYDALIADINAHTKVLFTVHMGDIKAGNTWCQGNGSAGRDLYKLDPVTNTLVPAADNVYAKNLAYFGAYRNAAIYQPGDNEWTDCHRTNNGSYNPTERLNYIRTTAGFFNSNQSLGQRPITLQRQSGDINPLTQVPYIYKENVMWRTGNIIFVGLNQPGSNNNHQRNVTASDPVPTDDNEAEYAARSAANIVWIQKAFAAANLDSTTKAVVIMQQANVFERYLESAQKYTESGYAAFVNELRTQTVLFGKPVVLVGGDTHTVRIDKPFTTLYPGACTVAPSNAATCAQVAGSPSGTGVILPTVGSRIQNFTRVEVFGSPDVAWIRAVVDPFDPNVFSFSMQTIAGTGHGRDGFDNDDDLQ